MFLNETYERKNFITHINLKFFNALEINECQSSPCAHGLCKDKVNSYVCECTFGYIGFNCDICKYTYEFNFLSKQILNEMLKKINENIQ